MQHATFADPDLTVFCRLDELGLVAVGQRLEPDRAVIECRVAELDPWCRACGAEGMARGTVTRRLAHEPFGHRPTTLLVRVRRYHCGGCRRVWRQDTTAVAPSRAKLPRRGLSWALEAVVVDHLTVARVAAGLGVSWHTANSAVLAEGRRVLIDDPTRFEGVRGIGVDEHAWRHTRHGEKYVTVIIDLTPVRDGTGPSRLLDMVEGRSKAVFKDWLSQRPAAWREGIEVVAMDGFTGFKTPPAEEIPDATTIMDPFHVVRLAGQALDICRRRVQQDLFGRRGMKGDPLYTARRTLLTGAGLLQPRQIERIEALFADELHAAVEATWGVYQDIITAYREPERGLGKHFLTHTITRISTTVPAELLEIRKLGRTLKQRAADIVGYFDRPGTSNGPTEAIQCRRRHWMAYADV